MSHILPEQTRPYEEKISREHAPSPGAAVDGWKKFRPCLRWELGFTCAICLLHERDFVPHDTGAAKTGQLSIEHIEAQSINARKANEYTNCLYLCRYCNGAKRDKPVEDPVTGSHLLNPVEHVWGDHFENRGDELAPLTGDGKYTQESYGINDALRTERRRSRRELLGLLLRRIEDRLRDIQDLVTDAAQSVQTQAMRHKTKSQWGRWRNDVLEDVERLRAWSGIPRDCDLQCHCRMALAIQSTIVTGWRLSPDVAVPELQENPAPRFRFR